MSRIEEIKAYKIRKIEEEKQAEIKELNEIDELIGKVQELRPRIEELIETANVCVENGIPLSNQYWGYKERLITDSYYHTVGLVQNWANKKFYYVGFDGGGACGKYDFRTDGFDVFDEDEDTREPKLPSKKHLTKFLERYDEFETKFYAYVDKIIKG